jgi:hypothetical protein
MRKKTLLSILLVFLFVITVSEIGAAEGYEVKITKIKFIGEDSKYAYFTMHVTTNIPISMLDHAEIWAQEIDQGPGGDDWHKVQVINSADISAEFDAEFSLPFYTMVAGYQNLHITIFLTDGGQVESNYCLIHFVDGEMDVYYKTFDPTPQNLIAIEPDDIYPRNSGIIQGIINAVLNPIKDLILSIPSLIVKFIFGGATSVLNFLSSLITNVIQGVSNTFGVAKPIAVTVVAVSVFTG